VELRGIEPLSRNKQLLASTCLDNIARFNMVSRNVQSYTMRASKIRLQVRQPVSIAIKVMILSKSAYMASAVRAAQICSVKLTLRVRKLGGNLYCLRLLLVGRLTICPNRHATRNHLLLSKPSQPLTKIYANNFYSLIISLIERASVDILAIF